MKDEVIKLDPTKRVYISGPMTGLPDFNYPAFDVMEKKLINLGIRMILNPAKIANGDTSREYTYYIKESIDLLLHADYVVFLKGWTNSKGALLEYHCAKMFGCTLLNEEFTLLTNTPESENNESICQIADRLVDTSRQDAYGHPFHHFSDVGRIWGTILDIDDIPPEKIGLMMAGLKIAREKNKNTRDNLIDGAGYLKTIDVIHQYTKKNNI